MSTKLAYLAQGKLIVRNSDVSQLIESQFGREVINRSLQRQAKNEWKTGGDSASALYTRSALWGSGGYDGRAVNVRISAVAPGSNEHELIYAVSTESVSGLFSYNLDTHKETRLFHKEQLHLSDFSRQPESGRLACCQRFPNGAASIALWKGNSVEQVTEGDAVDEAPAWVPGQGNRLVYQCAGIARNQRGFLAGVGPTSIQRLDLDNGSLTTLLEDPSYDFLNPHVDGQGDMYFIRRPYEPLFKRSYPLHKMLMDMLLFPFRICKAIFHFLNVFSMAFSKEPLTTASGPKIEGAEDNMLFLRGRIIDAAHAMRKCKQTEEPPCLVPKTWQLVRRKMTGEETVIADGVLSYDLRIDGSIVFSTGMGVYETAANGDNKKLLFRDNIIDTVVVLD